MSAAAPESNGKRVAALLAFFRARDEDEETPSFNATFIHGLRVVSVSEDTPSHHSPPRIVFGFSVRPEHCNLLNNMHGGAVATLFDIATSFLQVMVPGIAADEVGGHLGVSRTLAVTYVRPAPCGTDVLVECETVHVGRSLSSLRGTMRRRSDGAVLATCEHGKVQISPLSSKI